ncbi:unnamed protein product [Polarella glacialis]|uniref:Endonuclease/exonuclease/phosphatase domain-containing protein n=1 Tax=Polarella glacialis TaxID=89957 RepID=A0A813JBR8_POLGL|nr:unnamed protein product [Polarella glacialis]
MCEFLEKTNLVAVNAVFANAASCTWHNTRGHAARIDYILTSTTALEYTTLATVDYRLGFLLQLPNTTMLADHSPVFWHFRHPCPMRGRRQETWTRRKVQNLCFDGEGAQRLISAVDKWAASDQVQNAANAAEEEQRVDSLWKLLNEAVRSQLNNSKQLSDLNNFLTESPETAELLQRRWELRKQLHELEALHLDAVTQQARLKERLRGISRLLHFVRKQSWNERQRRLAYEMENAAKSGNWRIVWACVRQLSQSS